MTEPVYKRVSVVCAEIGISRATLYRWLKAAGKQTKVRGGCAFVDVKFVSNYIEGK